MLNEKTKSMFRYKVKSTFERFSTQKNIIFPVEKLSKVLLACIQTCSKSLLPVELINTIASLFASLSNLVTELHRYILSCHGKLLELDSKRIPANNAVNQYADALAKAWSEYNNPRAVIMIVVQAEERNMYDQHFVFAVLRERHNITTIRKTLTEVDQEGEILPNGTLLDGQVISVIYFRAGYTPDDYPSESEWRARLLMEQSSAVKFPSIWLSFGWHQKVSTGTCKAWCC